MNLFRYMDALDRIEEARRGPRGLLDDGWFDTYGNRAAGLSIAGQGSPAPFAPMPAHDPFNDWYQARLREALDATYARLRAQSVGPMPLGRATPPTWPAGQRADAPSIYLLSATQTPFEPASAVLPLDRSDRSEPPSEPENGDAPPEDKPDYGYPWYEPKTATSATSAESPMAPSPESLRRDSQTGTNLGPEAAASKSPIRSFDERNLERAEAKMRAYVQRFREAGYHTAADHLERYLSGVGGTMVVDRDHARSFAPIRNAEQRNDLRFERSFLSESKSGHAEKLRGLRDGEGVEIGDDFAADHGALAFARQAIDPDTRDYALAFGRLGLKSVGNFTATRRGDEIHIDGIVDHTLKDPYDFNPGGPYSAEPNLLERHGKAQPFERRGVWSRRVRGTIRLEDGQLRDPHFTWEDIDR